MKSKPQTGASKAARPESLIGRSYVCCQGPRKGQTITVLNFSSEESRYTLEAERGGQWTISRENLLRIFGPDTKRKCQCYPLAEQPGEISAADVQEEKAEPAAGAAAIESSIEEDAPVEQHQEQEVLAKSSEPATQVAITQDSLPRPSFTEQSAQGMLF